MILSNLNKMSKEEPTPSCKNRIFEVRVKFSIPTAVNLSDSFKFLDKYFMVNTDGWSIHRDASQKDKSIYWEYSTSSLGLKTKQPLTPNVVFSIIDEFEQRKLGRAEDIDFTSK